MKGFRNYAYLALGLVAAVVMLTLAGTHIGNAKEYPQPSHVIVDNWPTDPIPVEVTKKPARKIFRDSYLFSGGGDNEQTFTNDGTERLVIETITAQCWFLNADDHLWPEVFLRVEGVHFCFVPLTLAGMGSMGVWVYQGNQQVQVYVQPGETIAVRCGAQPDGGTANGRVSLFGYYEEAPPTP